MLTFKNPNQSLLLVLMSFSLVAFDAEATVSDYDYLRVQINQLKSETSGGDEAINNNEADDTEADDVEKNRLESFDEIRAFFSDDPIFVSHCYQGPDSGKSDIEVLQYIPENSFYRKITFQLYELRFGFELMATIEMASEGPFFQSYQQTVDCTPSEVGCRSLRVSPEEISATDNSEDEEEITKNEDWVFYLSTEGDLYAEASFSMSKKERNWIGAPVGTKNISQNAYCYLEPTANDELPLFTGDSKQNDLN